LIEKLNTTVVARRFRGSNPAILKNLTSLDCFANACNEINEKPKIADLGCGTGCSTEALCTLFPDEKIVAIDFAAHALERAQAKIQSTKVEFLLSDFEEKIFQSQSMDLIFSNMSLQWSLQLEHLFEHLHQAIQTNGLLAFSVPVEGNFPEIQTTHKNIFVSQLTIERLLQKIGFTILMAESAYYQENFDSPLESLRSLRKTGTTVLVDAQAEQGLSHAKSLNHILVDANSTTLTYHIGFFIAQK
jgi:malonyl-CoA O-methyltransferase